MENNKIKLFSAPLQGYTDAPWRNIHNELFGGIDTYYTPFLRIERGTFRNRDIRDILPENNTVPELVPQIIACAPDKTIMMADRLKELGYKKIDINLGCPFPLIANKCMGSGMLPYPARIKELFETLSHYKPDISFSLKMRLGYNSPDEAMKLIPYFDIINPVHVTIHPRIGVQQYKGDVDINSFREFYNNCNYDVVYNGDIMSAGAIDVVRSEFPRIKGIMIGRGLLSYPFLAREYKNGNGLDMDEIKMFHDRLYGYYESKLQGESQLLNKMKTIWDYLYPSLDKKLLKGIKKSSSIVKYHAAINKL